MPTRKVLGGIVDRASDYERPPRQAVLDVFQRVGPAVAPYLEAAIKTNPRNKSLLAQGLKLVGGNKPASKGKRA